LKYKTKGKTQNLQKKDMSRNDHDALAKAAGINTVYPGNK